ncbi:MAG: class I SAM-dependent methyltransferase [Patescibacteria group bacterium]
MKRLPESEIYERGLSYWPYRTSLQAVLEKVVNSTPAKASLLDVMCGPGYLLGQIAKKRSDLTLHGIDIDKRYVQYGRKKYPDITFEKGDVLKLQPGCRFDVVVCTGSLHHLPYNRQEDGVVAIASMVKPDGFVIISDCYVDDYNDETERKVAAAKLGYEYLKETIENGAPDPVVEWTADILWNDVLMHEFKTSVAKRLPMLQKHFAAVMTSKKWPAERSDGYGDYIHTCAGTKH